MLGTTVRRAARVASIAVGCALGAAPAAHAGLSTWSSLPGSEGRWVREYATGSPASTIYAALEGGAGVLRSTNSGISWSSFEAGLPGGDARNVRAVIASGSDVLIGTGVGVFRSQSGGAWQPLGQGEESDPKTLNRSVQALLNAGGTLLAGTFAAGVSRSTDGGATWIRPAGGNGMPAGETVWSLTSFGPLVLAATSSGVYRSSDSGASWSPASDGLPFSPILRVFGDDANPNIYYAGTAGSGMYRTINAGVTWQPVNEGLGPSTIRDFTTVFNPGKNETRFYAATPDGAWAGRTDSGPLPGKVRWRKVTQTGLGANTIFWGLSNFLSTPGTLLAGTQSNGAYSLTFQPPVNVTAPPAPTGTLQVGKTLTASPGAWSGTPTIDFTYRWKRCTAAGDTATCSFIAGAEEPTYVLVAGDQGRFLRVEVTATNDFPTFDLVRELSAATAVVAANPGTLPGANQQSAPTITGPQFPAPGDTLTATGAAFNPAASSGVSYRWERCPDTSGTGCVERTGVTGAAYVLTEDDVEQRLRVTAIGANSAGSAATQPSGFSNEIFPRQAQNLELPVVLGQPVTGETLVGAVGTWASPRTTYARSWQRCDADGGSCQTLGGVTGATYAVTAADVGSRLRLVVVADTNGPNKIPAAVAVASAPSAVVTAPAAAGTPGAGVPVGGTPGSGTPGGGAPADASAPVLGAIAAPRTAITPKRSAALVLRSSEAGTARLRVERVLAGRRAGARCVRATARNRRARRCDRFVLVGTLSRPVVAGTTTVRLTRRVGSRTLAPGRYRVRVTVRDAAGNVSAVRDVRVRVARR